MEDQSRQAGRLDRTQRIAQRILECIPPPRELIPHVCFALGVPGVSDKGAHADERFVSRCDVLIKSKRETQLLIYGNSWLDSGQGFAQFPFAALVSSHVLLLKCPAPN